MLMLVGFCFRRCGRLLLCPTVGRKITSSDRCPEAAGRQVALWLPWRRGKRELRHDGGSGPTIRRCVTHGCSVRGQIPLWPRPRRERPTTRSACSVPIRRAMQGGYVQVVRHVGTSSMCVLPSMRKAPVATPLEKGADLSTLADINHWTLSLAGTFPGGCASGQRSRVFPTLIASRTGSVPLPAAHFYRYDA